MGGPGKKRGKYRNKKKLKDERKVASQTNFPLVKVEQGNFKMEAYYAAQGMHHHSYSPQGTLLECPTDAERNDERLRWRTSIGTTLPASFRTAYDIPESLKARLETELEEIVQACEKAKEATSAEDDDDDSTKHIVHKIPFLPHAYQLGVDRKMIRKDPALEKLFQWMKQQTDAGFITRQETVSMVPPVVLAPQPDDSILDMCAAPGSKTCQILEKLSPKGSMVANDSSYQRAYMLVHQLRRIMHNNPVVLVTSCDAQFFPQQGLTFDRILADVPCSGDGTSRKNIGIWKNWNQLGALALHVLQLDIAWKGVALLKVGGSMCYSTCSHNPVENEAVVAELLRRANGSLELVDAPLEGFRVRPGMRQWKVLAEEKSMREIKNEGKKNNAKMNKRRAEWKQKEKESHDNGNAQAVEEGDKAVNAEGEAAELMETTTAADSAEAKHDVEEGDSNRDEAGEADQDVKDETISQDDNKGPGTNDGDGGQKPFSRARFEAPSSWDDETLLGLARTAGLTYFKSVEDVPKNLMKRIKPSCFPPTEEEAQQFHLEKCIRCLAHDNDTGGFFVALLRKVAPVSRREARGKQKACDDDSVDDTDEGPEEKRAKLNSDDATTAAAEISEVAMDDGEDQEDIGGVMDMSTTPRPIKTNRVVNEKGEKSKDLGRDDFIPVKDEVFEPLTAFYGLADTFPRDQLMTRACGDSKILYYLGKSVKENYIDKGVQKRVTIINSGVKGFVRNTNMTSETAYRVAQEGVSFLLPHMTKRKVLVSMEDFRLCMTGEGNKMVKITDFSEEFSSEVSSYSIGPFVALLKGYETEYSRKLVLAMWRCRGTNVNCLVSKAELEGMRTKLAVLEKEEESRLTKSS